MCLNVNGSLENKLECIDFVNSLVCHDIIVLSECWINANSVLNLNGFECISKYWRRRKRAKRDSGGICCFVSKRIWPSIEHIEWDFEDGIIILLKKSFFHFDVLSVLILNLLLQVVTKSKLDQIFLIFCVVNLQNYAKMVS